MAFTQTDVLPELRFLVGACSEHGTSGVPRDARASYLRVQVINFRECGDTHALAAVRLAESALHAGDSDAAQRAIKDEITRRNGW